MNIKPEVQIRAMQICLKEICDNYRDLRIAFYSHPGHLDDGLCPSLHKAYAILAESLEANEGKSRVNDAL
jgi:hypothetical protein